MTDFFTAEIAKGNAAAAIARAEAEAFGRSEEGRRQAAECGEIYAARQREIRQEVANMRAERRRENEACFNVVRAPYSGRVVARYRVR